MGAGRAGSSALSHEPRSYEATSGPLELDGGGS